MFDYKVGGKPPSKNMPNGAKQIKIFSTTNRHRIHSKSVAILLKSPFVENLFTLIF